MSSRPAAAAAAARPASGSKRAFSAAAKPTAASAAAAIVDDLDEGQREAKRRRTVSTEDVKRSGRPAAAAAAATAASDYLVGRLEAKRPLSVSTQDVKHSNRPAAAAAAAACVDDDEDCAMPASAAASAAASREFKQLNIVYKNAAGVNRVVRFQSQRVVYHLQDHNGEYTQGFFSSVHPMHLRRQRHTEELLSGCCVDYNGVLYHLEDSFRSDGDVVWYNATRTLAPQALTIVAEAILSETTAPLRPLTIDLMERLFQRFINLFPGNDDAREIFDPRIAPIAYNHLNRPSFYGLRLNDTDRDWVRVPWIEANNITKITDSCTATTAVTAVSSH